MNRYEFTAEQRALLEGLSQPLAIYQFIDKRVATLILSDGFCDLFGYEDRAQAYYDMDNDMYVDTHPDDAARIADAAFRFATEGGTYEVIYRSKRKNASGYRIVHAMGKHVFTEDGTRLAHVWYTDEGTYTDEENAQSTELNRTLNSALREESLVRASNYDYLTGLPSMTYFFELADAFKETMLENGEMPVLLYMDFNGMKYFNTQNSFATGDKLLQEFAKLLRTTFSNESCCRMGSDHFAAFTCEQVQIRFVFDLDHRFKYTYDFIKGLHNRTFLHRFQSGDRVIPMNGFNAIIVYSQADTFIAPRYGMFVISLRPIHIYK